MPTNGDSLADRVQSSFRKLSAAASELNLVSDDLGKSVGALDAALKKLNLGLTVWVSIRRTDDMDGDHWAELLGYAKIEGKWGVALRTVSGNYMLPDKDEVESWLFNDGPRSLRLTAIGKIPELLENLSVEAEKTAKEVRTKLAEAKEVVAILKKAAEEPPPQVLAPKSVIGDIKTESENPPPLKAPGIRRIISSGIPSVPSSKEGSAK
jgi:hypothetical protein